MKTIEEEATNTFWAGSTIGDPLWEEWVLDQEVLDLLEKPFNQANQRELWVLVQEEPNEENQALLLKIAASIGYNPSELRIVAMASLDSTRSQDFWTAQPWLARKVLYLGISMPEPPLGTLVKWATAPDLTTLSGDEKARKWLWGQIKGWLDATN